jgi:hypothetical protein
MLIAAVALLVVIIVALVLFGDWFTFAIAIALMILGLFSVGRYVQRITRTRSAPRPRAAATKERVAEADDPHEDLSPHDLPPGGYAHREVEHRAQDAQAGSRPARDSQD